MNRITLIALISLSATAVSAADLEGVYSSDCAATQTDRVEVRVTRWAMEIGDQSCQLSRPKIEAFGGGEAKKFECGRTKIGYITLSDDRLNVLSPGHMASFEKCKQ